MACFSSAIGVVGTPKLVCVVVVVVVVETKA